jgi:multidrug efflux pump subunit AcrB
LRPKLESGEIELPPGYWYSFGGEAEQRDEAIAALLGPIGVLMVLMVATLVLSFGSFRLGAVILAVAALAAGPGLLALWVFGFPFGFMAIVGTMGLIGVAINDSIVVLAALEADHMARERSLTAITDVVLTATRHVLATTVTTIAGFIPLLLSGGRFWPPLAIAIAGGVSGSTLLALYFVPSMYLLVKRRKEPEFDSGREFHAILDEIDEPYAEPVGSRVR